jgi:hypothetical protein
MVKEITGYKWNNKNGSKSAEEIARIFYGYPINNESVTQTCFEAVENVGSEGSFWYYEGSLEPLGNTTTFNINVNDEDI